MSAYRSAVPTPASAGGAKSVPAYDADHARYQLQSKLYRHWCAVFTTPCQCQRHALDCIYTSRLTSGEVSASLCAGLLADLEPSQVLERLDQRMVALGAETLRLERTIELEDQRGARQRHTQLVGCRQHQAHVLLLKIDCETGPPVALQHLRPAVRQ